MTRWHTRAAVTLAAAALVVPTTATSATAAAAPGVPKVAAVAKIYPYLAGGSATTGKSSDVRLPSKKCNGKGTKVKGAKQAYAYYMSADPADMASTGKQPTISVTATRFPSAARAKGYLKAASTAAKKCATSGIPGSSDLKVKVTKIKLNLGQQRWGYQVKITGDNLTIVTNSILVRQGKNIVTTGATSQDGTAPAKSKSVKLTKLALKSL